MDPGTGTRCGSSRPEQDVTESWEQVWVLLVLELPPPPGRDWPQDSMVLWSCDQSRPGRSKRLSVGVEPGRTGLWEGSPPGVTLGGTTQGNENDAWGNFGKDTRGLRWSRSGGGDTSGESVGPDHRSGVLWDQGSYSWDTQGPGGGYGCRRR